MKLNGIWIILWIPIVFGNVFQDITNNDDTIFGVNKYVVYVFGAIGATIVCCIICCCVCCCYKCLDATFKCCECMCGCCLCIGKCCGCYNPDGNMVVSHVIMDPNNLPLDVDPRGHDLIVDGTNGKYGYDEFDEMDITTELI